MGLRGHILDLKQKGTPRDDSQIILFVGSAKEHENVFCFSGEKSLQRRWFKRIYSFSEFRTADVF